MATLAVCFLGLRKPHSVAPLPQGWARTCPLGLGCRTPQNRGLASPRGQSHNPGTPHWGRAGHSPLPMGQPWEPRQGHLWSAPWSTGSRVMCPPATLHSLRPMFQPRGPWPPPCPMRLPEQGECGDSSRRGGLLSHRAAECEVTQWSPPCPDNLCHPAPGMEDRPLICTWRGLSFPGCPGLGAAWSGPAQGGSSQLVALSWA